VRWLIEGSDDRRTWTVVDVVTDETEIDGMIVGFPHRWMQVSPVSDARARAEARRITLGGTA